MKRIVLFGVCIHLCGVEKSGANSQTVTVTSGLSRESVKQNGSIAHKKIFQWMKQFLVSREFFGLSTIFFILKYIIDAKAAQKDLDNTNKKLDEVERHGVENKKSLELMLKSQTNLSTLLSGMQEKITLIDGHATELKTNINDLQITTQNTKKNTKKLDEKINAMQQLITTISEQVGLIQIDLSTAQASVAEGLIAINILKTLDQEQKELLVNLHKIIQNNAVEISALQSNITDLYQQYQTTSTQFGILEENLQKTHEKIEDSKLHNEVIKTQLSEQYTNVRIENQMLERTLKEVQGVVAEIYNDLLRVNNS